MEGAKMKQRKYCLCLVGIMMLITAALSVSATSVTVNDPIGDVYHWKYTETTWSWKISTEEKPNIDIIMLEYVFEDSNLMVTMDVVGTIEDAEGIGYVMYLNGTDNNYWMQYSNGEGVAVGYTGSGGGMGKVTADGSTLTALFPDISAEPTNVQLWGYAYWYSNPDDMQTSEWWGDWAPGSYGPEIDDDDDDDDDEQQNGVDNGDDEQPSPSTPGFEVFALIAAIGIALVLLKRRK